MDEDADILSDTSSLHDYAAVIRRRKWVVIGITLAFVAITLAYSLNQPSRYSASAYVKVPPPGGQDPLDALDPSSLTVDQQRQMMQDEQTFARGDAVTRSVERQLGEQVEFQVDPVVNSTVMKFTGVSGSPRTAAAAANAAATAFLQQSLEKDQATLTSAIKAGDSSAGRMIDEMRALPAGSASRDGLYQAAVALQQKVASARSRLNLMTDSGGSVLIFAKKPSEPFEPQTSRNVAIAAVLGLIAGIAAAFVIDRLDDTVRTRRDIEVATDGRPILGQIPWISARGNGGGSSLVTLSNPRSAPSDAYRMLRTSIEILNLSDTQRVISVTSPKQAEGKSLTVANLAVVFARADRRVVAVGCDFREPTLHERFGLSNDVGLTSVLLGEATLDQALRSVEGAPNLAVLPSGPTPPNPSEVLSLPAVAEVLRGLSLTYDYVLIDTPPVLPVPDAVQVTSQVDGVVVAALARRTRKRELRRALEVLTQAEAPVIGVVLGGAERNADYGYGDASPSSGGWFRRTFRRGRTSTAAAPAPATSATAPTTVPSGNSHGPTAGQGVGSSSDLGAPGNGI